MLDFRMTTFLDLCETRSYTKTAERLHLTQPAVSQHIRHLEESFGCKLFAYAAKTLSLTQKGERLREFAQSMRAGSDKMLRILRSPENGRPFLTMGATLTIGEYVAPPILSAYLAERPQTDLCMYVNNTETLLKKLSRGEIDMALIEGTFQKSDYAWQLFSREKFLPVCAPDSPYAAGSFTLDDLTRSRIIVREKGSGTRQVLETLLSEHDLSLKDFAGMAEIGNFSAIKRLVADGIGVTFVYREVVRQELCEGTLVPVRLEQVETSRDFHFVYLKHSAFEEEVLQVYDFFKSRRSESQKRLVQCSACSSTRKDG